MYAASPLRRSWRLVEQHLRGDVLRGAAERIGPRASLETAGGPPGSLQAASASASCFRVFVGWGV